MAKKPVTPAASASPVGHFSVTQIKMLQRCPRQYEFRYVNGKISPPALPLAEGSAHHQALEYLNGRFVAKKKWPKLDEVLDLFHESWKNLAKELPRTAWDGENKDSIAKRGRRMQEFYYNDHRPRTKPLAVEQSFEAEIAGQKVIGFIDLVEPGMVSDYKVITKVPSPNEIDNHSQLALYSIVSKLPKTQLILFRKVGSGPVIETRGASYDRGVWSTWWELTVSRLSRMVSAGIFPPCEPSSWWCSERFCGYWKQCRGAKVRGPGPQILVQLGGLKPRGNEKQSKR